MRSQRERRPSEKIVANRESFRCLIRFFCLLKISRKHTGGGCSSSAVIGGQPC